MPSWARRARWRATLPTLPLLLSVQAGYDPRAPLSNRQDPARFAGPLKRDFKGTRIAWLGDFGGHLPFEPGMLDLCKSALKTFEALGCTVEEAVPDYPIERVWQHWKALRAWQSGSHCKRLYADPAKRALMKPEAQFEVETGPQAFRLRHLRRRCRAHRLVSGGARVLRALRLFPAAVGAGLPVRRQHAIGRRRSTARMDTYHRWMEVMIPVTMAGCPALNVPAGFGAGGLADGHADRRAATTASSPACSSRTPTTRRRNG